MLKPFQTVAVLGAGVMGSQIAAHLANIGLSVELLDLAAPNGNKNAMVETAFQKALNLSPPIFYQAAAQHRIRLGNYDEHFDRVAQVDWIIEAVVENLDIKRKIMDRVEMVARADAVISSNTSGLPIQAIAQELTPAFRKRFLGTHFFNPPRYLKLLELIPTADTDPEILAYFQTFARVHLGKGVVVAKDTPNFIANRIGMYVILLGLKALVEQGYSIPEIETLTGPLVGRPKSATFRTADLVGLDTLYYVAQHLYTAVPEDESRAVFQVPDLLKKLVETGSFGAKTRQGFYKKVKQEILTLNPETLAYESPQPLNLGDLEPLWRIVGLPERLRRLYDHPGRGGHLFHQMILATLAYCARRIPEIAESPVDIDQAMKWGFGWELGPFEIWDSLGFQRVCQEMKAESIALPDWILEMIDANVLGFYNHIHDPSPEVQTPEAQSSENLSWVHTPTGKVHRPVHRDQIDLRPIRENPSRVLWANAESALLDMGEGVALFDIRSKGNTLSLKVIEGLETSLTILRGEPFKGLVIGNDSAHFSGGANLAEMGQMAKTTGLEAIVHLIETFQALLQRIHYFHKPIVAALQGRALGGGCELVMACPHVVAAAESYIGLVELSVGLIPGAGGIMRMVDQVSNRAASPQASHIQPFLQQAFETIAMSKVSGSAYEAQEWGYLKATDQILINGDRLLFVAKDTVLRLHRAGYRPPAQRNTIQVLGQPGRAVLEMAANVLLQGRYISEYDRFLAGQLAYVMTGGELTEAAAVSEEYLLQLERQTFTPLLGQPKTLERIAHTLKTKKPLRN